MIQEPIEPTLLCPACSYDLRGIVSGRCPECGIEVDRTNARVSRIPWEHRATIGTRRAYWRTVRLAMFHPYVLAEEIARPVDFDAARRFTRRTAMHMWIPAVLLILWAYMGSLRFPVIPLVINGKWQWLAGYFQPISQNPSLQVLRQLLTRDPGNLLSRGFVFELIVLSSFLAMMQVLFIWITRVGSYFFQSRWLPITMQNRAIALSYYGCAPLACAPLIAPFVGYTFWAVVLVFPVMQLDRPWSFIMHAGWISPLVLLIWCDVILVIMLRRTTRCGFIHRASLAFGLPLVWMGLTIVAISVPAGLLLLALMYLSVT